MIRFLLLLRAPSAAAGVSPAAMLSTGVLRPMVMIMMPTLNLRVKVQLTFEQRLYRLVSHAGYAAVQPDARRCQGRLSAAANPAADQGVCLQCGQYASQSAMPASIGADNFG